MRKGYLVLALLVSACGEQSSKVEQTSPNNAINPQKILYPDIEANNLYGLSCAFVPEGGGIGAIALAMPGGGYLKLDGEIRRFKPEKTGQAFGPPSMTFVEQDLRFTLELNSEIPGNHGGGTREYHARFGLMGADGDLLYEAGGISQCGA